jgi:hypothetical protein
LQLPPLPPPASEREKTGEKGERQAAVAKVGEEDMRSVSRETREGKTRDAQRKTNASQSNPITDV